MLEENIIRLPITLSFDNFYNNSFSSYEASLQEDNYRGHKLPHSPTFVLIIRSYIRYVIYEVFIDHGVIMYA